MTRPSVEFTPCMRFGEAHIRGISVDAIVSAHWVGDDAESDYGLSRAEVLVACWYAARHGTRVWRKRWGPWLAANNSENDVRLWREDYEVELPPTREDGKP